MTHKEVRIEFNILTETREERGSMGEERMDGVK
jgi:hypothetical protein